MRRARLFYEFVKGLSHQYDKEDYQVVELEDEKETAGVGNIAQNC